jgi:hypothetical protein
MDMLPLAESWRLFALTKDYVMFVWRSKKLWSTWQT